MHTRHSLLLKSLKKYLYYNFSSNQNQLKDTSDVYYFKNCDIWATFHTILKMNFQNFAKKL